MRNAWLRLRLVALATLLLHFSALPLPAGQRGEAPLSEDWNVLRLLRVLDRIEVKTRDKKSHPGRFIAFSEEAISLRQGKREVGYRREEVHQVWALGNRKVGKGALIGYLVGAAAVAVPFGIACETAPAVDYDTYCLLASVASGVVITGPIGAGIGAAIGAGIRERTLIYRAPPPAAPGVGKLPSPTVAASGGLTLPAPLSDAYRVFSAEQAAREATRELARPKAVAQEGWR